MPRKKKYDLNDPIVKDLIFFYSTPKAFHPEIDSERDWLRKWGYTETYSQLIKQLTSIPGFWERVKEESDRIKNYYMLKANKALDMLLEKNIKHKVIRKSDGTEIQMAEEVLPSVEAIKTTYNYIGDKAEKKEILVDKDLIDKIIEAKIDDNGS